MTLPFPPTRTAALERLRQFVPKAGRAYAKGRNHDDLAHVSTLSPYLRHRLITEEEVLAAVLSRHSHHAAEKFVQEVIWRGYWKGWLEMRPAIWASYKAGLRAALNRTQTEETLRARWAAACAGETDIDCFNYWAKELVATGYLHNHARMWFASIWIFTLRLPWELGADFFLRHLLDGDPASNTLSWRWVAGLHTPGKHYLATPSNIETYTDGRFRPSGLTTDAAPLAFTPHPAPQPVPVLPPPRAGLRTGLLLTEEDLSPGYILEQWPVMGAAVMSASADRSPLNVSRHVMEWTAAAQAETVERYQRKLGDVTLCQTARDIKSWAQANDIEQILVPFIPVGPARDAVAAAGLPVVQIRRSYDSLVWPLATAGFFKLKKKIPGILDALGLA